MAAAAAAVASAKRAEGWRPPPPPPPPSFSDRRLSPLRDPLGIKSARGREDGKKVLSERREARENRDGGGGGGGVRATVKPPNERTNVGDREREEEEVTPQAVLSTPLFCLKGGRKGGGAFILRA